ncbi:hypothetical protein HYV88_03780 [Candidatus Woesearchaeota archaeon]|nr:hypothetical protein [Candidatus Woesearchaeota archaeon]
MKRGDLGYLARILYCEKQPCLVRPNQNYPFGLRNEVFLGYRALCQPKYPMDGRRSEKSVR